MTKALSCVRCDRDLYNAAPSAQNQPGEGLAFTTRGHYGSTVFDPMDGSMLELNVCDSCLRTVAAVKQVLLHPARADHQDRPKARLFEG